MRRRTAVWSLFVACCLPTAARAGWTAKQIQDMPGHSIESNITYAHHRLKIENGPQVMLIDLRSGDMTFMHAQQKRWATVSLEELVRQQNEALTRMESQLDTLPPAVRKQVAAQLEAQKRAAGEPLELKKTNAFETIDGRRCRIHEFSSVEGAGKACLTDEDPFDLGGYRQDARGLRDKLAQMKAGGTKSSMVFLELAGRGFPLKTEQTLNFGGRSITTTVVFEDLKPVEVPTSAMKPPPSFEQVSFQDMMGGLSMGPATP